MQQGYPQDEILNKQNSTQSSLKSHSVWLSQYYNSEKCEHFFFLHCLNFIKSNSVNIFDKILMLLQNCTHCTTCTHALYIIHGGDHITEKTRSQLL